MSQRRTDKESHLTLLAPIYENVPLANDGGSGTLPRNVRSIATGATILVMVLLQLSNQSTPSDYERRTLEVEDVEPTRARSIYTARENPEEQRHERLLRQREDELEKERAQVQKWREVELANKRTKEELQEEKKHALMEIEKQHKLQKKKEEELQEQQELQKQKEVALLKQREFQAQKELEEQKRKEMEQKQQKKKELQVQQELQKQKQAAILEQQELQAQNEVEEQKRKEMEQKQLVDKKQKQLEAQEHKKVVLEQQEKKHPQKERDQKQLGQPKLKLKDADNAESEDQDRNHADPKQQKQQASVGRSTTAQKPATEGLDPNEAQEKPQAGKQSQETNESKQQSTPEQNEAPSKQEPNRPGTKNLMATEEQTRPKFSNEKENNQSGGEQQERQVAQKKQQEAEKAPVNQQQMNKVQGAKEPQAQKPNRQGKQQLNPPVQKRQKERVISFIHIGKAGGLTMRSNLGLTCSWPQRKKSQELIEKCINRKYNRDDLLGRQTRYYMHMWDYAKDDFRNSTSFLFTIRNPVDRMISTYKYSHPANCFPTPKGVPEPYGCNLKRKIRKFPRSEIVRVFKWCFPNAGIEEFAQSVMSPWKEDPKHPSENKSHLGELPKKAQWDCRRMARGVVDGTFQPGVYHANYNYEYYTSKTYGEFGRKEILAVRTEHEWDDIADLANNYLGGNTTITTTSVSHGSENYKPSPITTEAYHKLCCVLEREIEIYTDLLRRAKNLKLSDKEESINVLKDKCGVEKSLDVWRKDCKRQLERDETDLRNGDTNLPIRQLGVTTVSA